MNGYWEASLLSRWFFQLIDHVAMIIESQACNHTGLGHSQVCEIFVDTGGIYKRRVTGLEKLRREHNSPQTISTKCNEDIFCFKMSA